METVDDSILALLNKSFTDDVDVTKQKYEKNDVRYHVIPQATPPPYDTYSMTSQGLCTLNVTDIIILRLYK